MKLISGTGRKILYISMGALLCLLLMGFGLTATGVLDIPFLNTVIARVFVPVQSAVTDAIGSVRGAFAQRRTQMELTTQIDQLTEENKILEASLSQMNELSLENERLKALLGVTRSMPDQSYIAATVTGKEPGGWFETFVLDVGSQDGVQKNDPVLSADGLVGRVTEVRDSSCVVMSIIDSRSSVAGLVERTRDNGVVSGSLYLTDDSQLMRMYYLPEDSELTTGDRVITSGLDGIFPKGLYIGQIRSISREQSGEGRYVVVDAAADFAHLENVLVMLTGEDGGAEKE